MKLRFLLNLTKSDGIYISLKHERHAAWFHIRQTENCVRNQIPFISRTELNNKGN